MPIGWLNWIHFMEDYTIWYSSMVIYCLQICLFLQSLEMQLPGVYDPYLNLDCNTCGKSSSRWWSSVVSCFNCEIIGLLTKVSVSYSIFRFCITVKKMNFTVKNQWFEHTLLVVWYHRLAKSHKKNHMEAICQEYKNWRILLSPVSKGCDLVIWGNQKYSSLSMKPLLGKSNSLIVRFKWRRLPYIGQWEMWPVKTSVTSWLDRKMP